jgi:hypothetical protein
MDLAKLAKKSLYTHPRTIIRTNVFSKKIKKETVGTVCRSDSFTIENLSEVESYAGLQSFNAPIDWENLFCILLL